MIETYRGVVYPSQMDHMGHMNVQWYTSKFDEATWHFFAYLGITNQYIVENEKGMAALEQTIKYKAEVMSGDLLYIRTQLLDIGDKTLKFIHSMYDATTDKEVATSELLGVHLDKKRRKGCQIPQSIRLKCEALLENTPTE